jgi:succinylglutamate desuccinylase
MKIMLNILTHGDEIIGLKVAKELKKLKISKDILTINIANKKAYKLKTRCIDSDLNRSFPGNKNGNYEERLAYKLNNIIKEYDIVFDIHSTTSSLKDALIVTKFNKDTQELIDVISPKYLLFMNIFKDNALLSNAKIGIGFEYGNNDDVQVLSNIVTDIKKVLAHLNIIDKFDYKKRKTKYFKIDNSVIKPVEYKLLPNIENYRLIKKGTIYATDGKDCLIADRNFYPILFGEKTYANIFGFEGIKIKKT